MLTKSVLIILFLSIPNFCFAANGDCFRNTSSTSTVAYMLDSVTLKDKPSDAAKDVINMQVGDVVCILKKRKIHSAEWVFVLTQYIDDARIYPRKHISGWLPSKMVARLNDFKRLTSWKAGVIDVEQGDYFGTYVISGDATFSTNVSDEHKCKLGEPPNEYGACEHQVPVRGWLIRKGKLIFAQSNDGAIHEKFYVNDQAELCSVYSFTDPEGRPMCQSENSMQ